VKIILTLLMCSYASGECMPPFKWPTTFDNMYDCSIFGYEEAARKLKEIGREEVESYRIFCFIPVICRFVYFVH
jgi:hypothetical protein